MTETIPMLGWTDVEIEKSFCEAVFYHNPRLQLKDMVIGNDYETLQNHISKTSPHFIFVKRRLLDARVFDILVRIREEYHSIPVMIMVNATTPNLLQKLEQFNRSNGSGFGLILNQNITTKEQLLRSIYAVVDGKVLLPQVLAKQEKMNVLGSIGLTTREVQVLEKIAQGCTNSTIAARLGIDVKTVRQHINNLYSKFSALNLINNNHPRVSAARLYFKATGQMNENSEENAWQVSLWNAGDVQDS